MNINQQIEFDKIKELWAELALTDDAKEKIKETTWCLSESELRMRLKETTDARDMIEKLGTPPLQNISDMKEVILVVEKHRRAIGKVTLQGTVTAAGIDDRLLTAAVGADADGRLGRAVTQRVQLTAEYATLLQQNLVTGHKGGGVDLIQRFPRRFGCQTIVFIDERINIIAHRSPPFRFCYFH